MNTFFKTCLASLMFILLQTISLASYAASPVGSWKTIDDVSGTAKSIVKISGSSTLSGTVVKLFPGSKTTCTACKGSMQNKPILGMTIMHGFKQDPKDPNKWSGGRILDPNNGEYYRCTLTVSSDGSRLDVRGYIGISAFGRSQTWVRSGQ